MRASQIALISAGTVVTGVLGYAVYFDYMRRNSPEFRKGLKKQHKKIKAAADAQAKEQAVRDQRELTLALVELELEVPPSTPEQMETYFQEHVALGEGLAAQGPENFVKSATHFYRALRVYPQPVELLMSEEGVDALTLVYQKVCPEPVFQLVLKLTQLTTAVNAGGSSSVRAAAGLDASLEDVDDSAPAGSEKTEKKEEAEEKEEDKDDETAAEHIEETLEIAEEAAAALETEEKSSNEGSGASWDHVSNEA